MDDSNKWGRPHREWMKDIVEWCGRDVQEKSHSATDHNEWQIVKKASLASDVNGRWINDWRERLLSVWARSKSPPTLSVASSVVTCLATQLPAHLVFTAALVFVHELVFLNVDALCITLSTRLYIHDFICGVKVKSYGALPPTVPRLPPPFSLYFLIIYPLPCGRPPNPVKSSGASCKLLSGRGRGSTGPTNRPTFLLLKYKFL